MQETVTGFRLSVNTVILQKVHVGDTVGSKAFILLFSGKPLLRNRYRKFLISLCIQFEFQSPRHFFSGVSGGSSTLARLEKVVTVRRFSVSAIAFLPSSRIDLNFFRALF